MWVLTKQGKVVKTCVKELVGDVWSRINGYYDANCVYEAGINRDFVYLTDVDGEPMIFNRRFLLKVTK